MWGERKWFHLILLPVAAQFSQHHHQLLKGLFPIAYSCHFCYRLTDHVTLGFSILFFISNFSLIYHFKPHIVCSTTDVSQSVNRENKVSYGSFSGSCSRGARILGAEKYLRHLMNSTSKEVKMSTSILGSFIVT